MSDEQQPAGAEKPPGGGLRKVALYGLLALMLVALGYDYKVARPAVDEAYDKIVKESTKVNATSGDVFTNADVAKLLDKEPAEEFQDGADLVEVYTFKGGLPFKPHKLYAVYKKQGDDHAFYRHAKFVYEASSAVAPISVAGVPEDITEAELAASAESEMAAAGSYGTPSDGGGEASEDGGGEAGEDGGGEAGGGEAGGRPGGGARPGGGFDPGAMFDRQDTDGDGKLSGDEISERMQENLAEVDKDSDGSVSKEEMLAYIEARRAQGGGGGRPGGDGPPRERERPPLEEE